ncbi:MAG: hypothetical protein REH79_02170 [Spiroplasma sp.]|nr:hypothetical protein [Spiroplasma sp.]
MPKIIYKNMKVYRLHRNDESDHEKGRPAILLKYNLDQSLVWMGTTKEDESLIEDPLILKLGKKNSYFYLNAITKVNTTDLKERWTNYETNTIFHLDDEQQKQLINKFADLTQEKNPYQKITLSELKNDALQKEKKYLTKKNDSLRLENNDLKLKVDDLEIKNKDFKEIHQPLTNKNETLTKEKESLQRKLNLLKKTNATLKKQKEKLKQLNDSIKEKNQNLKVKNTGLKTENETKQKELQDLINAHTPLREKGWELCSKGEKILTKQDNLFQEKKDLRKKIGVAIIESALNETELALLTEDKEKLIKNQRSLHEVKEMLAKKLENLTKINADLKKEQEIYLQKEEPESEFEID